MQSTLDFGQLPDQLDPSILYQDTSIALFVVQLCIRKYLIFSQVPRSFARAARSTAARRAAHTRDCGCHWRRIRQNAAGMYYLPDCLDRTQLTSIPGRIGIPVRWEYEGHSTSEVESGPSIGLEGRWTSSRNPIYWRLHTHQWNHRGLPDRILRYQTWVAILRTHAFLPAYLPITAGDLDPALTSMTLIPLKVAYKKLRFLVDRGCIFIGHGLAKDFRIISESNLISRYESWLIPHRHIRASPPSHRYCRSIFLEKSSASLVFAFPDVVRPWRAHTTRYTWLNRRCALRPEAL